MVVFFLLILFLLICVIYTQTIENHKDNMELQRENQELLKDIKFHIENI